MFKRLNQQWRNFREAVADYLWDDVRAILAFMAVLSVTGSFLYLSGAFEHVGPYAWYAAGRIQAVLRGPGDAEESFARALRLKPAWGEVYYRRGLLREDRKDEDRALQDLEMAAEFLRNPSKAYRAHGRISAARGAEDQALWDFNVAMNKEPGEGRNYLDRARLYMTLKRYQEALSDYQRAFELDPELVDARIGVEEAKNAIEQEELRKKMLGE